MDTKKPKRGRPRTTLGNLKSESILLRMEPREKRAFLLAADIAGIPLAIWIRERLRRAATRELEESGKEVAFLCP